MCIDMFFFSLADVLHVDPELSEWGWWCYDVCYILCPRHDNGRGIKCYPCPFVHTCVCLS